MRFSPASDLFERLVQNNAILSYYLAFPDVHLLAPGIWWGNLCSSSTLSTLRLITVLL